MYVHEVVADMQAQFGVSDIRFPPNGDHPMAFGRWKGALAASVRASPPPAGDYVAFKNAGELIDTVVEALVPLCAPENVTRAM